MQWRARRQPARVELVARRSGVRPPCRRSDRGRPHRCPVDRRDDGRARAREQRPADLDRGPARNRCARATPRRCAARSSARCRPTAASCATPPGCEIARESRCAISAALADELPPRRRSDVRGAQPAARLARHRRRGDGARGVAWRAHARRLPRHVERAVTGGSCCGVPRRRSFVPLRDLRPGCDRVSDFDPPAPVLRALVALRARRGPWAARRHHVDRRASTKTARPRPRSSPAKPACSPAPRPRPRCTARSIGRSRSTGTWPTASAIAAGTTLGRLRGSHAFDPRRRARRVEPPLALLGDRVVDAPVRRRRSGDGVRIRDTRKTLPGLRAAADVRRCAPVAGSTIAIRSPTRCSSRTTISPGCGITEAVDRARARWPGRVVEVECDTLEQVAGSARRRCRHRPARQHDAGAGARGRRGCSRARAGSRCRAASRSIRCRRSHGPGPTSSRSARSRTRRAALDIGLDIA